MTTEVYELNNKTIFYTCHITNLDEISVRILDCELIYTNGKYDPHKTGAILGKQFSEIEQGFEINIDTGILDAINASVLKFYNKYKSLEIYSYKK